MAPPSRYIQAGYVRTVAGFPTEPTYEERVHCDEYYARNWSPWFDVCILGKTVKTVLRGDGAY
jgi:lipopolysaccharide/colanic/teichoic acid biosynthesis glycosyltransferase